MGDPLEQEDTYRILFKQVPVPLETPENADTTETTVDMRIVLEYHTRVWLTPKGLNPNLAITEFSQGEREVSTTDETEEGLQEKTPTLDFTVANDGHCHGYIRHPELLLRTIDGKFISLDKDLLRPITGQIVMKEESKKFRLSWNDSLPPIHTIKNLRLKTKQPKR